MRFVFLVCGFLGFAVVAIGGFSAGRAADLVLRDAALGCLAGALLGRWFWQVLVQALEQTIVAKRAAEAAAAGAAASAPPPASAKPSSAPRAGATAAPAAAAGRAR